MSVGLSAMQGALDWHPAPKPVLEAAIEARKKAASHGVDIGTLAIKEAIRPKGIAVTLVGMRTPDEASPLLLHICACLPVCVPSRLMDRYSHGADLHRVSRRYLHGKVFARSDECGTKAEADSICCPERVMETWVHLHQQGS